MPRFIDDSELLVIHRVSHHTIQINCTNSKQADVIWFQVEKYHQSQMKLVIRKHEEHD